MSTGRSVSRLLAVPLAEVIGDWSYSLYLWHWPILLIAEDRLDVDRLPLDKLVVALALIFGLSALTYRFVEEPFRHARLWARPRLGVALYPLSLVMVLTVALSGRAWIERELGISGDNPAITTADFQGEQLSKDPHVALVQASTLAAEQGQPIPSDLSPPLLGLRKDTAPLGDCDYRTGTRELCPSGDVDSDRVMVLVGDSHARAWSPAFAELGEAAGVPHLLLRVQRLLGHAGRPGRAAEPAPMGRLRGLQGLGGRHGRRPAARGRGGGHQRGVAHRRTRRRAGRSLNEREEFRTLVRDGFAEEIAELEPLTDRLVVLGNTPKLPREPGVCLSQGAT